MAKPLAIRGSARSVTEIFYYSVNSILFQRGVYPRAEFEHIRKWGVPLVVTTNQQLIEYLKPAMHHIKDWLKNSSTSELSLLLMAAETPIEQWQFSLRVTDLGSQIEEKDWSQQIRQAFRHIGLMVTALPLLHGPLSFRIIVKTDAEYDCTVWNSSCQNVPVLPKSAELASLSADGHLIVPRVLYK